MTNSSGPDRLFCASMRDHDAHIWMGIGENTARYECHGFHMTVRKALSTHTEQAAPTPNNNPYIQDLVIETIARGWYVEPHAVQDQVIEDIRLRKQVGIERYGTALQAGNGRDMVRDLYEEILDGAIYARGAYAEGRGWAHDIFSRQLDCLMKVKHKMLKEAKSASGGE